MSTTRLPELPPAKDEPMLRDHPYYGAAEVHAYGLAVWKAAMEAAAGACERLADSARRVPYCPDGDEYAAVIENLPLPEQGGPQERRE